MTLATSLGKATPVGYYSINITLFSPRNVQVGIIPLPELENENEIEGEEKGETEGGNEEEEEDKRDVEGVEVECNDNSYIGRRRGRFEEEGRGEGDEATVWGTDNIGKDRGMVGGGVGRDCENDDDNEREENLSVAFSISLTESEVTASIRYSPSVSPALPDFEEGEGEGEGDMEDKEGKREGEEESGIVEGRRVGQDAWRDKEMRCTVRAADELYKEDEDEDKKASKRYRNREEDNKGKCMKTISTVMERGMNSSNHAVQFDTVVNDNNKNSNIINYNKMNDNNSNNNSNSNNDNNNNNNDDDDENFFSYDDVPPMPIKTSVTNQSNKISNHASPTFSKITFFTENNISDFYSSPEIGKNELEKINTENFESCKFKGISSFETFIRFDGINYVEILSESSYLNLVLVLSDKLSVLPCDFRLWLCSEVVDLIVLNNNHDDNNSNNNNNDNNSNDNNSNNDNNGHYHNDNSNKNDYNYNYHCNEQDNYNIPPKTVNKKYKIERYVDFLINSNQIIEDFIFYIEIFNSENKKSDDLFDANYRCIRSDEEEWLEKLNTEIINNERRNIPYSQYQSTSIEADNNDPHFEKNYTANYTANFDNNLERSYNSNTGYNNIKNDEGNSGNSNNFNNYDNSNDNNNDSNDNVDFHCFNRISGCGLGSSNKPLFDTKLLSYRCRNMLQMSLNLINNDLDELFKYYTNRIEEKSILLFIKLFNPINDNEDDDKENKDNNIITKINNNVVDNGNNNNNNNINYNNDNNDNDYNNNNTNKNNYNNSISNNANKEKSSSVTPFTTSLSTIGSIVIDQYTTYSQFKVKVDAALSSYIIKENAEKHKNNHKKNHKNTSIFLTESLFYSFVRGCPMSITEFARAELDHRSEQRLNPVCNIKQVHS